jgi:CubicO group peptidase (beta-lactamase class C family)
MKKLKISRKATSLVLFILLIVLLVALVTTSECVVQEEGGLSPEIEKVIQERVDNGYSASIVVGLLEENGSQFYGYGKLDELGTQVVNENTLYEIGSITKVFTSLLLADMVEKGELSLDDPIDKFLPPEAKVPMCNGQKITLEHLATHTSGLPRMPENFAPQNMGNPYVDYTVEEMYKFLSNYTLTRDIGSQYEYSNFGFGLLGYILELKSGMSFEELVKSRIGEELGLKDTTISLTPEQQARLAKGHVGDREVPNWDFAALAGAGALRSTASDLLTFLAAEMGLKESKLYPAMEKTQRALTSSGTPGLEIGLGWHIYKKFDSEILWHNGQTGGYSSFIGLDKNHKKAVVVLSNSTDNLDDLGLNILNQNFKLKELKKAVKADPSLYDDYLGEYVLVVPNLLLTISREEDKLFAQVSGQDKFEIFPLSETRFFYKITDAEISFIRDETGKVNELILYQGIRAKKKS